MRTQLDPEIATGDAAADAGPRGDLVALGATLTRITSAFFSLAFALLFGVPGLVLLGWTALAVYKVERAFEWALWAANHSPVPLTVPPMQLANDLIQDSSLVIAGVVGAILCFVARHNLRTVRQMLAPPGTSHDGKGRIVLKTAQPRVGRPLEGSIHLAKDAKPGARFTVQLLCEKRTSREDGKRDDVDTAHSDEQEVSAVRGAHGWSVPFRFEVPATAPPSPTGLPQAHGYRWRVEMFPSKAFIAVPTKFPVVLAGAPATEVRTALEARETPAQKKVLDAIAREHGTLPAHDRARLQKHSPEELASLQKSSEAANRFMKKAGKVVMIVLLVAFAAPVILAAILFIVGAVFGR